MKYITLAQALKTTSLLLGLLFLTELPIYAHGQTKATSGVDLSGNNVALVNVFAELEKQTGFTFLFRQNDTRDR